MRNKIEGIHIIQRNPILQKAFAYIVDNSTSNYLPYHNLTHLLTVLKYVDYFAHGEGVYFDKRTALHLAALFHDVNHSGGKLSDAENIENAIKAFLDFYEHHVDYFLDDKKLIEDVIDNIKATQFPYVQHNSNITLSQKIIRDADMMQQFEYNWINHTTLGLAKESNVDIRKFIHNQRHFLESTIFLTETANEFKKRNWVNMIDEFRILEVCLGINT